MTFETENPFALRSTLEYEMPDFNRINDESYLPAFYAGCEQQLGEVHEIINQEEVTFENTIVKMELSGQVLMRMMMVFYNKSSSDSSPRLDEIEEEIAPKLAAHMDAIRLNQKLWGRIKHLYDNRDSLNLNTEDAWLLERYYRDFTHAGAHLTDEQREQFLQAPSAFRLGNRLKQVLLELLQERVEFLEVFDAGQRFLSALFAQLADGRRFRRFAGIDHAARNLERELADAETELPHEHEPAVFFGAFFIGYVRRIVDKRRLMIDHADGQTERVVNLTHPDRIATREIVVDRDDMARTPCPARQNRRQRQPLCILHGALLIWRESHQIAAGVNQRAGRGCC